MFRKPIFYLSCIVLVAQLSSCVPARKFKELQSDSERCETERIKMKAELERLQVEANESSQRNRAIQRMCERLQKDSADMLLQIEALSADKTRLNDQYNDLQATQEALLRNNSRETTRLLKQLQQTQEDLQHREDSLSALSLSIKRQNLDLDQKSRDLQNVQREVAARDARIKEMERIMASKDSAVKALRNKVSGALTGFENNGLTISVKNGKVYVSLEERLLFQSGSTSVDPKGVEALKKLAQVLEQNNDINVMIEGHTDDVPYKPGSSIKDNWDLSVLRATSIVRILLSNGKIDPKRLVPSGRSEFLPIDAAKNSDARRKNRRTEIILTPKLDELLQLLDNN